MLEQNRLAPCSSGSRKTTPNQLAWPWAAALSALVTLTLSAPPAWACTDDKDCKGDRICDHSVCKTPRVPPPDAAAPAAVAQTSPAPARSAQMVIVEPTPAAQPEPAPPPLPPPPLVMIETAPQAPAAAATQPAAILPATAEPPPGGDGSYAPSAGFRCLLGEGDCAFQLRPLEVNWTHVDLHGDVLLGAFSGGDLGIGAGTRHWQLGGPASPYGMVVRWDNDLVVVASNPAGVSLVTVGLDTGPRIGFSFAVSRDLALEATLNGGLFLGYGVATSTGVNQWTLSGYTGLLLGARM